MEIIKPGKHVGNHILEGICSGCFAVMHAKRSELRQKPDWDHHGDEFMVYYELCPDCKQYEVRFIPLEKQNVSINPASEAQTRDGQTEASDLAATVQNDARTEISSKDPSVVEGQRCEEEIDQSPFSERQVSQGRLQPKRWGR